MRSQAAAERDLAAAARAAAASHEALAEAASGQARGVHLAAAAAHRHTEALHLSVAQMAESIAGRLDGWLSGHGKRAPRPRLVAVAADMLGTPSVAGGLGGAGRAAVRASASDATARTAWEAEAVTGQGPATLAFSGGKPCSASGLDLAERWPLFANAAAGLGVRAVVAAPLDARLGVVCAYYREPIINPAAALALAGRVAAALTRVTLRSAQDYGPGLIARPGDQGAVHQATGMVSVQAGCSLGEARDLLAARAYADGVTLARTACDVLRGAIRLEPVRPTPPTS